MDMKELLGAIPDILKYGIPGLSVILLFFSFLLLKKESEKEKPSQTIVKSIKFYLYISAALIIVFLTFELLSTMMQGNSAGKEWAIEGDIELLDNKEQILQSITKNKCGEPLGTTISIEDFLEENLKIIIFPKLPYKSFVSKRFSAKVPENLKNEISQIFFDIDGFHCISENCRIELNSSNYKLELEPMRFMQDQPNSGECSSSGTP